MTQASISYIISQIKEILKVDSILCSHQTVLRAVAGLRTVGYFLTLLSHPILGKQINKCGHGCCSEL